MNLKEFNNKLKQIYPALTIRLDNCGITNMFSNHGTTDEYQELNLYKDNKKVKTLRSNTIISGKEIETLLDEHYKKYIEPKLNCQ